MSGFPTSRCQLFRRPVVKNHDTKNMQIQIRENNKKLSKKKMEDGTLRLISLDYEIEINSKKGVTTTKALPIIQF